MFPHILSTQNISGSLCAFPHPALDSLFLQEVFIYLREQGYLKAKLLLYTNITHTYLLLSPSLPLSMYLFVMYDASVLILIRIRKFQLKTTSFLLIMLQILFLTVKDTALICSVKGPSSQSYGFSSSHVWM